ncbi:MAG TPA: sugar ABC transporter permease [Ktedonobacteraceae bacterium]|nr:sugar ABC transporter permease [Ktedonobacteraceae bacterium]
MLQTHTQSSELAAPVIRVDRRNVRFQRGWRVVRTQCNILFILPALIIFLVFGLYTVIYSFVLSFFRWNGFSGFSILPPRCVYPVCQFVGLDNFRQFLYQNPTMSMFFWKAIENNLIMTVAVTVGTIIVALPLALALNRLRKLSPLFRTVILLPMVTAGIAVYYVWTFIYQSDGLLNAVLKVLGLNVLQAQQGWLGDPARALGALIVVMVWSSAPASVLLYLTGLQTIDASLTEAARIDGATPWQSLWHVIWPLLRPITVIVVILGINGTLQNYELVYLMTNGGPAGHTSVVGLQIFNYGFGDQRQLGVASAMSWILFLAVFIISMANLRLFRAKD